MRSGPLTGRGANLRARTGSVSGVTAVDVEDMTGDEPGLVRRDEHDAVSDLLGEAEPAERNLRRQRRLRCSQPCRSKRVNIPVSVGPGATAFTRIPDLAVSSATDLVIPSTACLAPT